MDWRPKYLLLRSLSLMVALQSNVGWALDITVTEGGYENVVVALGNELTEANCPIYVGQIQAMIESASTLLHAATEDRMFFSSIIVLIPTSWTTCDKHTIDPSPTPLTFEDAHIRIETSHPFFADNPFTQQPRGCSEPGDYMYFSDTFLNQANPDVGSQDQVFVHEWAKFRWGVFEEYGHSGDSVFPSAYRNSFLNWSPNYCTNGDVKGSFDPVTCTDSSSEGSCIFTPDLEQTGNTSSSLLATPFINSVDTFCSDGNHNPTVPTKHNLMCDKRSTWEVISEHGDIVNTPKGTSKTNISYSVQQMVESPSHDRLVFLLDITKPMGGASGRWEYLRDAVKQFILEKATDGSQVTVMTVSNAIPLPQSLITLNSTNREEVAQLVPIKPGTDTAKNVAGALAPAAETLGDRGKIILITENLNPSTEDPKALVQNAKGLAVQPILYPATNDLSTEPYDQVASIHSLSPQIVLNNLNGQQQSLENMITLTQLIQSAGQGTLTEVTSGYSGRPVYIGLTVQNASIYESDFFIELLSNAFFLDRENFEVKDPSGVSLEVSSDSSSSVIYKGTLLQDGVYQIKSNGTLINANVSASLVSIAKNSSSPYSIGVSASQLLSQLVFSDNPPTAPVIYATLSNGNHPIVFADVKATIKNVLGTGEINSFNLALSDSGTGGDVTGNDGTYSSYLVGINGPGIVSISISASDNNGYAKIIQSTTTVNAAPVNPAALERACCGSSLIIPADMLGDTEPFLIDSAPGLSGQASGTFAAVNTYPPGRITDLKGVRINNKVNLTFSATGEDFNIGRATSYKVSNVLGPSKSFTEVLNISVDAGTLISTLMDAECGRINSFTVQAFDSQGKTNNVSNEVHVVYSCVSSNSNLSGGAIAGITIGCVFFVILLIVILYACLRKDKVKDSKVGKMLVCPCCSKKNKDKDIDKRRSHLVAPRTGKDSTDVIRSNPVPQELYASGHIRTTAVSSSTRGIEDLHRKPVQSQQEESDTDGGFRQHHMRENMRMEEMRDDSSLTSSAPSDDNPRTRPSNQIGVPLANSPSNYIRAGPPVPPRSQSHYNQSYGPNDNPGYNDSESGVYSVSNQAAINTRRPILPPITRRNNTQV